jgi:hypothetical protein
MFWIYLYSNTSSKLTNPRILVVGWAMTLLEYLKEVDQIECCEIEKLVDLANVVVVDRKDLNWELKNMLLALIINKIKRGLHRF